jgi:hypothetical protein
MSDTQPNEQELKAAGRQTLNDSNCFCKECVFNRAIAIAMHTRYKGKTAEEWARLQQQTAFVVSEVNLRAEAAEAKVKELAAKLDAAIAEAKREAQPARCERHKCAVPSLNSICEICDHEEAVAEAVSRTKDKCADAAEAALQAAPDYDAMHTMVREAIMQVGNEKDKP